MLTSTDPRLETYSLWMLSTLRLVGRLWLDLGGFGTGRRIAAAHQLTIWLRHDSLYHGPRFSDQFSPLRVNCECLWFGYLLNRPILVKIK